MKNTATGHTDYPLAPALAARFVGALVLLLAFSVMAMSIVFALAGLGLQHLVLAVGLLLVLIFGAGYWLMKMTYVLRLAEDGYRVRMVRGAGVRQARWSDVKDVATTHIADEPCLVLRLRDGRRTTIPTTAIGYDREQLVRDVQARLNHGHGLKPYTPQ